MRGYIRTILILVVLAIGVVNKTTLVVGIVVFCVGVLLHFWTAGCLARGFQLSTLGPYAMVRHPFYLANAVVDLGICIIGGHIFFPLCYFPVFYYAYKPTVKREESDLANIYGESYLEYAKSTKRFLPTFKNGQAILQGFRFRWLLVNKEIPRVIRFITYPAIFVVRNNVVSRMQGFPPRIYLEEYIVILLAILIYFVSVWVRRLLKGKMP